MPDRENLPQELLDGAGERGLSLTLKSDELHEKKAWVSDMPS